MALSGAVTLLDSFMFFLPILPKKDTFKKVLQIFIFPFVEVCSTWQDVMGHLWWKRLMTWERKLNPKYDRFSKQLILYVTESI